MKAALSELWGFRRYLTERQRGAFIGVIDFSYQHYALGDILTTLIWISVRAKQEGKTALDLVLTLDPAAPSAPVQAFINPQNYRTHLENLYPALLCAPNLRSLRLIRDRRDISLALIAWRKNRTPTWPTYKTHLSHEVRYPLDHWGINKYFAEFGAIPLLQTPRGYERWADSFFSGLAKDRVVVTINPRQASLTAVAPVTYRDAPLEDWYRLFHYARRKHPEVMFVMVGGYIEWEHRLQKFENVFIPRAHGLTLGNELAILLRSAAFMGTSSGFGTAATFSDVPYVILNIEHFFGHFAGVAPGSSRYPFAKPRQSLDWESESFDRLVVHLEALLNPPDSKTVRNNAITEGVAR